MDNTLSTYNFNEKFFAKADMNSLIRIISILSPTVALLVADFYCSTHRIQVFHEPKHVTLDGKN